MQAGAGSRTPIPRKTQVTIPRHRGDDPRSIHLAHPHIAEIREIDIAFSIHEYAGGTIQAGAGSRASIPRKTQVTIARYRENPARCIHLADAVIPRVCDEEIPPPVHENPLRIEQTGVDSQVTIPGKILRTITRHGRDDRPFTVDRHRRLLPASLVVERRDRNRVRAEICVGVGPRKKTFSNSAIPPVPHHSDDLGTIARIY